MDLKKNCNERVTIERRDGTRYEDVLSLVTGKMVLVPDGNVPIAPGDAILRQLPSGLVDRLIVVEPSFHSESHVAAAHYQVKYRREDQQPAGTPGHVIHVNGPNARVNLNSVDNSTNTVSYVSQNMECLVDQLAQLRTALVSQARDAEHYVAIGSLSSAEIAAKSGDPSKVTQALSMIGTAGKWVLEVAKEIGVEVASEALKKSMGG